MMNIGRDHHDLFPRSTSVDRDYADTPPSRGVFRGNGGSVLSTDVRIERHPRERPRMQHSEERGETMPKINDFAVIIAIGAHRHSLDPAARPTTQAKGHRNNNEMSGHGGAGAVGLRRDRGPRILGLAVTRLCGLLQRDACNRRSNSSMHFPPRRRRCSSTTSPRRLRS